MLHHNATRDKGYSKSSVWTKATSRTTYSECSNDISGEQKLHRDLSWKKSYDESSEFPTNATANAPANAAADEGYIETST